MTRLWLGCLSQDQRVSVWTVSQLPKIDAVSVIKVLAARFAVNPGLSAGTRALLNQTRRFSCCLGMIFSENRYPFFGIMP
jgi:hypothetical protein